MVKNRLNKLPDADLSGYFDKDGMPIPMTVVGQLAYLSARSWNPQSLDISGVLLRVNLPEEILPGYDFTKGWGALLTQGVKIIQVAGDHISMVNDENVVALAGKISELLDQKAVSQKFSVDNSDEDVEWENADITNNYG